VFIIIREQEKPNFYSAFYFLTIIEEASICLMEKTNIILGGKK